MNDDNRVAIFAGGCFWCLEAVYMRVAGVLGVESGYTGGWDGCPTYERVCGGGTGHAEAVRVAFDPGVVGYERLLDIFWRAHDPTTLNRQGADVGTQYRSAIFCLSGGQMAAAMASKERAQAFFSSPIVTEIVSAGEFFPAEEDHAEYYDRHPGAPYCRMVIAPKLGKLEALLASGS